MLTPDHTAEPKQESSPANELGVAMSHEGCEDLQLTYKTETPREATLSMSTQTLAREGHVKSVRVSLAEVQFTLG